ncbi:MAG: DUF4920 domain-containing protein [Gammaproteobacteria bacterium]|nr:DUF4920 domain-containing protein [Gammaproteobacteria bacterium]MDP2141468.1 DUF4920 domain-containing protein [Gammaproteobacteria bacterium]MDP2347507.1 DUF4920 domain-containing protein [Gammaproteobacteria bacterium]
MINKLRVTLVALGLAAGIAVADDAFVAHQSFGDTMPAEGEAVSLQTAISALETGQAQEVKVMGQITEVCQAKGCWMLLVDGESYARITFKDYAFFVPTETSMQRAVVYGVLEDATLSANEAAHFAQDAGNAEARDELLAAGKSIREYSLVAAAVQLENRL